MERLGKVQIEKKVSSGFIFVRYLFPPVLDLSVCAILSPFLSHLGPFMSRFYLSLTVYNLVSSSTSDSYPTS